MVRKHSFIFYSAKNLLVVVEILCCTLIKGKEKMVQRNKIHITTGRGTVNSFAQISLDIIAEV